MVNDRYNMNYNKLCHISNLFSLGFYFHKNTIKITIEIPNTPI